MRRLAAIAAVAVLLGTLLAPAQQSPPPAAPELYDPYLRDKNGPPLAGAFHKAHAAWLLRKLREPGHHPSARMPDFGFSEEQALEILAYLKRIAGPAPAPAAAWPAWLGKPLDDLSDAELEQQQAAALRGKRVWSDARCSICHKLNGPDGKPIGGFVDLRSGGADLQIAGEKLKRDWLFRWIKEPKDYFPETLMPRFRLSEAQIRDLAAYLLGDDAFRSAAEEERKPRDWRVLDDAQRALRGKQTILRSRCVTCHEIPGIPELLPKRPRQKVPAPGTFEFLAYDLRCLACHSLGKSGGTYAPDLASEGSRLRREWIEQFVRAPDMVRPLSQQMPRFNLDAKEAGVVADHMARVRLDPQIPRQIPGGPPAPGEAERGRALFREKGCFACHTTGDGPGGEVGPSLQAVADRLRPGYLWYHLKHPHAVNPFSAEPDYGLSDEQARLLAVYLAGKRKKR